MPGFLIVQILAMVAIGPIATTDATETTGAERFEKKVRPLLAARCWQCHGPMQHKGGLRLDSAESVAAGGDSGAVVVAGKPDESRVIQAIRHTGDLKMPPKGKLSEAETVELTEWVRSGAAWPNRQSPSRNNPQESQTDSRP